MDDPHFMPKTVQNLDDIGISCDHSVDLWGPGVGSNDNFHRYGAKALIDEGHCRAGLAKINGKASLAK